MKNRKFLENTVILSAGCFFSKLVGGFSRVPLTALLGSDGMGLYQLAYPFYAFLLTLCSAGISTSVTKMVADDLNTGGRGAFLRARKFFVCFGVLVGMLLFLAAEPLAIALGEPKIAVCFRLAAPSVPVATAACVYRGWFQGKNDTFPTAFSLVQENCLKVLFAVSAAAILPCDRYGKVAALFFGVTASELLACRKLIATDKKVRFPIPLYEKRITASELLQTSLPIAFSASVLPFSSFLDSVFLPKLLAERVGNALSAYGIYAGAALALVSIPVAVCQGVAVSVVPKIASVKSAAERKKGVWLSLAVTLALSVPCAVGLYAFCPLAVKLLFSGFSSEERSLLVSLVRILSVSAVFLPAVQTLSSCLAARGRAGLSTFTLLFSVAVKTVLSFFLVNEKNGICGAAHAANICYFLAFVLNLTGNLSERRGGAYDNDRRARRGTGRFDGEGKECDTVRRHGYREDGGGEIVSKRAGAWRCLSFARRRVRKEP